MKELIRVPNTSPNTHYCPYNDADISFVGLDLESNELVIESNDKPIQLEINIDLALAIAKEAGVYLDRDYSVSADVYTLETEDSIHPVTYLQVYPNNSVDIHVDTTYLEDNPGKVTHQDSEWSVRIPLYIFWQAVREMGFTTAITQDSGE